MAKYNNSTESKAIKHKKNDIRFFIFEPLNQHHVRAF